VRVDPRLQIQGHVDGGCDRRGCRSCRCSNLKSVPALQRDQSQHARQPGQRDQDDLRALTPAVQPVGGLGMPLRGRRCGKTQTNVIDHAQVKHGRSRDRGIPAYANRKPSKVLTQPTFEPFMGALSRYRLGTLGWLKSECRSEARRDLPVDVGPEPGGALEADTARGLDSLAGTPYIPGPDGYPAFANQLALEGACGEPAPRVREDLGALGSVGVVDDQLSTCQG
jgi:hypothetical protein